MQPRPAIIEEVQPEINESNLQVESIETPKEEVSVVE